MADLIKKKKKMYQKSYTCIEINGLLRFSDLGALILRYNNVTRAHISRDPKAFQPHKAESKLAYSTTIIK